VTALDDDLRAMFQDRTASPPTNPFRAEHVRRRIWRGRLARTGAALAVVTVIAGTAALVTVPDHTRTIPAGPTTTAYFDRSGTVATAPGQTMVGQTLLADSGQLVIGQATDDRPYLLVTRCPKPGRIDVVGSDLRTGGHPDPALGSYSLECSAPVDGGEYEGSVTVPAPRSRTLFGPVGQLVLTVHGTGLWSFAVLAPTWPDWLPAVPETRTAAFDGREHPAGGTFPARLGRDGGLTVEGQCVPGVVLSFRVGGTAAGTVRCTTATPNYGVGYAPIGQPDATVQVTVTRTGRDTGQWLVTQAGTPG
jgi:hypothetical protein